MSAASPDILFSLAEIDKKITHLLSRKNEIQGRLEFQSKQIAVEKKRVSALGTALQQQVERQTEEETKIKDEEKKIVDRRKQLTALGGAKAAKMVEREIDISTRLMQQLEERMMKTMEGIESSKTNLATATTALEGLESAFETDRPSSESALTEIEEQLRSSAGGREKLLTNLDSSIHRLYERVRTRYPGDPIAIASAAGSCSGCFRALPMNLFHQVLAGGTGLQCPGCSRILIPEQGEGQGEAADK